MEIPFLGITTQALLGMDFLVLFSDHEFKSRGGGSSLDGRGNDEIG